MKTEEHKKFGRPFTGVVIFKNGEEKHACYRKSVLRSLGKILKNPKKFRDVENDIKQDLKRMKAEDKKVVIAMMDMIKKIKCQKVESTEIVWNALYAWNRQVKETFFSNFACSYLFIKALPQIVRM